MMKVVKNDIEVAEKREGMLFKENPLESSLR